MISPGGGGQLGLSQVADGVREDEVIRELPHDICILQRIRAKIQELGLCRFCPPHLGFGSGSCGGELLSQLGPGPVCCVPQGLCRSHLLALGGERALMGSLGMAESDGGLIPTGG